MAIVFAEVGQDVHLTGGAFEDAVTEGVRRGYLDGYLRLSVVGDPLRRENTNDNTPCVLYTSIVPGGQGENHGCAQGLWLGEHERHENVHPRGDPRADHGFYCGRVYSRGSNPCPPIVIGVGLGGTSDKAAYLAKRALLRRWENTMPTRCMRRWSSRSWTRSTPRAWGRRVWAVR